ncbi:MULTISPECIES: glycosyltransferase 87 family protein [unclassified Pseudonocardia]|uniref:glycosyltransferase family 87 protein n=1 Tax=unclassified Pseudonocardia TaxID=2619320 RepID=UPI000B0F812C|nr:MULTISPECIES: glycosyltransferase 87 family protein [unclassified Pseudonocardia]
MIRTADGTTPVPGSDAVAPPRRGTALLLAVVVALTGLTLVLGYVNKARCTGPEFDAQGRSAPDYENRKDLDVCYSDIQHLWIGRDIDEHVFPYVDGGIDADGKLTGGTVEYPVLTGLIMWLAALGAHTDAGFLLASALIMAPFGLATGWLLGRLSRWRALLWALGPPLVLYAFHNWDLPVVACAVGAVFVLHGLRSRWSLRRRGTVAAVLLGLGFALKLYPGAFVLPLALYVLTRGEDRVPGGRLDWWGAVRVAGAAVLTVVAVNLPFAIAGFDGWRASFTFQQLRKVDFTTNSFWFWGFRPYSEPDDVAFQDLVSWLSPTLIIASFLLAAGVGLWRMRRLGSYPWVAVSAAMLCGFLLLHKVHSPQYTLWLLPFFVLLRVPWGVVAGYLVADAVMGIGIFRWLYDVRAGVDLEITQGLAAQAVAVGVWGRAALLVALFVLFLRVPPTFALRPPPPADAPEQPPSEPEGRDEPAAAKATSDAEQPGSEQPGSEQPGEEKASAEKASAEKAREPVGDTPSSAAPAP